MTAYEHHGMDSKKEDQPENKSLDIKPLATQIHSYINTNAL